MPGRWNSFGGTPLNSPPCASQDSLVSLLISKARKVDRRIFLFLCLATIPWLGISPEVHGVPAVSLNQDFSLRPGQSAMVAAAGLTVGFQAVLEDSRCPVNSDCVWAGNAKVALDVVDVEGRSIATTLNTELEPRTARVGSFELRLISLAPRPELGVPIPRREYTVTLRIVELPTVGPP